jgi:hypothetical protein
LADVAIVAVVAVPPSPGRRPGPHLATACARAAARRLGVPFLPALACTRHAREQHRLPRAEIGDTLLYRGGDTLLNRGADFPTAKKPNVDGLLAARDAGRIGVLTESNTALVEPGWITVETPQGSTRYKCDRIIARMGAAPPRASWWRLEHPA